MLEEMIMDFYSIMATNQSLLERAAELNTRAGRTIFPVTSRDDLVQFFTAALKGARRMAEIRDLKALLLPPLDEGLVAQVLKEAPDTITIFGREVSVEYFPNAALPIVRIPQLSQKGVLSLPDNGIHLPGGREVAIDASVEGLDRKVHAPSSGFKAQVAAAFGAMAWERWHRPTLPAPTNGILPVKRELYHQCAFTGVALAAFGTIAYDPWYRSWKSAWYLDRADAERVNAESCAMFAKQREEAHCRTLSARISALYYNRGKDVFSSVILSKMQAMDNGVTYPAAEMETLLAEAEVQVAAADVKKTAEAQRQREAETKKAESEKQKADAKRCAAEQEAAMLNQASRTGSSAGLTKVDVSKLFGGAARVR